MTGVAARGPAGATDEVRLDVFLDTDRLQCSVGTFSTEVPIGAAALIHLVTGDPPEPSGLTNAIGLVVDHLDDVERELPAARFADRVTVAGHGIAVLADVEVGVATALPFRLDRAAAEDLFRTLVTESAAERARNPGLPPEWVADIVGTCCAVVALMRHFDLATVELREASGAFPATEHPR
ncbi:MAG: hypothetical protein ACO3C1_02355 [Ilumatobacteraceae bacterium]